MLLFAISCYAALGDVSGSLNNYNGKARNGSIVDAGDARFTVLTPALIRLEWRGSQGFDDLPSLIFQVYAHE